MIIPTADLHTIITDPNGAETLVKWADQLGRSLKESGLTTSQIRALFGEVRQIEAHWSMGDESRQQAARRLSSSSRPSWPITSPTAAIERTVPHTAKEFSMDKQIRLEGRVFLTFDIEAVTGLHIGGTETGIEIGGVDKTVIRDPLTNRPYIPGSSLRGKMRSLLEKYRGLKQNQRIGQGYIHSCGAEYRGDEQATQGRQEYLKCDVCQVFGVPGERDFGGPTRLIVRDVRMSDESAKLLNASGRTDLPYTEVKTEVSIDRVTSAANPRQMERVPAGTVFGQAEMVYSIYSGDDCDAGQDIERLKVVVEGLQLLEDDYLGGLGSRGSGKVRLSNICVSVRGKANYLAKAQVGDPYGTLGDLAAALDAVQGQVRQAVGVG